MATTTTPTYSKTDVTVDDIFTSAQTGLTEDSVNAIKYLTVMANDTGGAGSSLFSVDDGVSSGGDKPKDLQVADAARTEALSSDYSLNGARIWINDGSAGGPSGTVG